MKIIGNSKIKAIVKLSLLVISFLATFHLSLFGQTTTEYTYKSNIYLGFGGSFGIRSQQVTSNYPEINTMSIMQEGGSGILIFGGRTFRTKSEIGFFYSSSNVLHTTDLVELSSCLNIYPLQFFSKGNKAIEPYLIAGIAKNQNRFYGFYHMHDSGVPINHSVTIEPYVGKTITSQATFGTGLEFHIKDQRSFLHLFAEAKYSKIIGSKNSTLLNQTFLSDQLLINVGFLVGRHY